VNEHLSAGAATTLIDKYGFKNVYALKGGFRDWKDRKLPLQLGAEKPVSRP